MSASNAPKNILVTSKNIGPEEIRRLSKRAKVYASWEMDEKSIEAVLPSIDVLVVFLWPKFLTATRLAKMTRLGFIQSILVGVNHVPFRILGEGVVVASNAGAYSLEVGEHAWGLLLAAAKRIPEHDRRIRNGARELREFAGEAAEIMVLRGKTLGIVGYGGIGRAVAGYAKAFGMDVLAFTRARKEERGVGFFRGKKGLDTLLKRSDAVVLSLPLTNSTYKLIDRRALSMMKNDAILVNIARGDLVDQNSLYSWLRSHPSFRYATDVWRFSKGQETLQGSRRFAELPNFVGTPHISGPTALAAGRPGTFAADNVIRYLRGEALEHVVDRSEYAESESIRESGRR